MFELIINHANGSHYWTQTFNDVVSANKWLEEEKTRPYWNSGFTHQLIDITPEPHAPDYRQLRAEEYPPMSEYLDAIVKNDEVQKEKYINDCLMVKIKYPKPSEM